MGPGEGCDRCDGSDDGLGRRYAMVTASAPRTGAIDQWVNVQLQGNGHPLKALSRILTKTLPYFAIIISSTPAGTVCREAPWRIGASAAHAEK